MVTPAERRQWRLHVLGLQQLSTGERVALLALQEFADFDTGRNARPGVQVLAEKTGLSTRTVDRALARGLSLGLIRCAANSVGRRAAVYELLPIGDSATPVSCQGSDSATRVSGQGSDSTTRVSGQGSDSTTLVSRLHDTGVVPPYQDQTRKWLPQSGTSPDGPLADEKKQASMEGGRPAKGKPPGFIDLGYGRQCPRHAWRGRSAPADCPDCATVQSGDE